jgi:hypothetical protein
MLPREGDPPLGINEEELDRPPDVVCMPSGNIYIVTEISNGEKFYGHVGNIDDPNIKETLQRLLPEEGRWVRKEMNLGDIETY